MTEEEIKVTPELVDFMLDKCVLADSRAKVRKRLEEVCDMAIKALEQEPCEDAISRRNALDALHMCLATNSYNEDVTGDSYICYEEAEYEIENLQSVQLKTKTGHWIKSTNDYNATSYMCSECGHWHPLHNHSLGFRYCNWCGVKMVEPQESEDKI